MPRRPELERTLHKVLHPDVEEVAPRADTLTEAARSPDLPAATLLTNRRGNAPARAAMLQRLQQTHGNHAVQRMLAVQRDLASPTLQEEEPLPEITGVGFTRKLKGHPADGSPTPTPTASPTTATVSTPAPTTTTTPAPAATDRTSWGTNFVVNLNVGTPTVDHTKSAEAIATAHERANIVGWAQPIYQFPNAPTVTGSTFTVPINLDFVIELAQEYTGGRLTVLQEHENHHVTEGRQLAEQYLKTEFQAALNALPRPATTDQARADYRNAAQAAETAFITAEEQAADNYDGTDYPRMDAAYKGISTPLAELITGSRGIARMAQTLQAFNNGVTISVREKRARALASAVIAAQDRLDPMDLAALQYNPELKAMVATATTTAESYIAGNEMKALLAAAMNSAESYISGEKQARSARLKQKTRDQFKMLQGVLTLFTWQS